MKPRRSGKILATLLAVLLITAVLCVAAQADGTNSTSHDRFADAGQQTHTVRRTDTPITLDGKISNGEWNADPIEVKVGDPGVVWMDWTTNGFPEDELTEIIPYRIRYYVTYNAEGLYVGAQVTEPIHYCPDDSIDNLWTYDCLEVDVALDAFDERAIGEFTEAGLLDRIRNAYSLVDNGEDAPYGLGYCYTPSTYGDYKVTRLPLDDAEYGIAREEQTTTYEIFFPWLELYGEEEPVDEVYINFQLHLADTRYTEYCEEGYGSCVGGIRYAVMLDEDQRAFYGTDQSMILHIFKLEGVKEAETTVTESATTAPAPESESESATAPETSTSAAPVSEGAATAAPDASGTETASAGGGCSSSLSWGWLVLPLSAVAAAAVGRKKKD